MSEEQFLKMKFKPFMELNYINDRMRNPDGGVGAVIPCMVAAVDFDERIIKLQPFPNEFWNQDDFWASYSHCELPKSQPKLTVVKKEKLA